MTNTLRPLVAGNWKMNGVDAMLPELTHISDGLANGLDAIADAMICVPDTLLSRAAARVKSSSLKIGAQNCHAAESGAHTGDVSAEMLADAGASAVIVGHSERRTDHGESDADVNAKTRAAWRAGLVAILCIGETKDQREADQTLSVLTTQLEGSVPLDGPMADNLVIAYEPVWAIGTGLTPTAEDVARAHAHIRAELQRLIGDEAGKVRLLYGGSVKPSNAVELMGIANVNGALIGGASLKAADFLGIAEAYRA